MLRDRDDAAVARLLERRPDLASPPPTDFSQIASRATTRHSVTQALQILTAFELWVAALAGSQPRSFRAADLMVDGVDLADIETALDRLLDLSLLWGDASSLRPVRAMAAMLPTVATSEPPPSRPPLVESAPRQPTALVDKVAAGSAFDFVRRIDVLVEHCDHQPAKLVRRGGLASRDIRALATLLDVPSSVAAAHLEIAQGSGLLAIASQGSDDVLLPTGDYDGWQPLPPADQWVRLVDAWVRHHPASGPSWLKGLCLEAFGDPADGVVVSAADLRGWLAWQRPRRHASADREMVAMLEQAAWLGVTGLGARSSFLSIDPHSSDEPIPDGRGVAELFPPRVGHVLVQADLTAIASGSLTPDAARDLGALADVESRGGATVYRFSTSSLQRAQRLGWTSGEILQTLERRSTTPLPQPLTYLITDLDRQPAGTPAQSRAPEGRQHRQSARAVSGRADPASTAEDRLDPDAISSIIDALRADEPEGGGNSSRRSSDSVFGSPVLTLREAVETGEIVWFGLVDTSGSSAERVVHALSVDGGRLTARDAKTRETVSIALHRITAAHIMRSGS